MMKHLNAEQDWMGLTEQKLKPLQFKLMHKTKPISKHFVSTWNTRDRCRDHSFYNIPKFLEEELTQSSQATQQENRYTINDFLQSLEAEHFPYYSHFSLDPVTTTAATPLRSRPCIDRINQDYLQRMGEVPQRKAKIKVNHKKEVNVKYFHEDDAPIMVVGYEEYIEGGEEVDIMREEEEE